MTQLPPNDDANQQPSDQPTVPQQPVVPPLAPTQGNPNVLGGQPAPAPQFAAPQPPQFAATQPPVGQPPYVQPPVGQPPYVQQPGQQFPAPKPPTNVMAIVAFVGSFFVGLVGIIVGHIALGQIKRTGESGRGFALAGTIIGYVNVALGILGVILAFTVFGLFGAVATTTLNESLNQLDQYEQELDVTEDSTGSDSGSSMWDSAANPALCDALSNFDLAIDDEAQYYKDILAETDNADMKVLLQEQIDYLSGDVYALGDEDFAKYMESFEKLSEMQTTELEACYGL